MFNLLNRSTVAVLALTILVASATSGVLAYAYRVQGDVDLLYTREASYASNRLRYELSRFEGAVHRAMYEPPNGGPDADQGLWYDIVWNRLDVIQNATIYATIPGFDSESELILELNALHRAHEELFLSDPDVLRASEAQVLDYFTRANTLAEAATLIAGENRRRLVSETGVQLRDLYSVVFILDSLTVLAFAVFAGLLIVQIRRQASQRRELEALSGQLQNALEAARTSIRHKDSFLAHMSHEFRTPLNAILGYAELISTRFKDDVPARCLDYLADIRTAGGQLLEFVNDLFEVSRLHLLGTEIQRETLSAADIVDEARNIAMTGGPMLGVSQSRAEIVVPEIRPDLTLVADRRRIVQVLINLITNAIKHSGSSAPITVSAGEDSNANIVFSVSDTGVGMDPEQAEHLFEPFWQRPDGAVVSKSGGLGLFISHELVALHGGRIDVISAPGKGTRIDVVLPPKQPSFDSVAA